MVVDFVYEEGLGASTLFGFTDQKKMWVVNGGGANVVGKCCWQIFT